MTYDLGQIDIIIGRNIRMLRKKKRVTQKDMANILGVTYQQIQKYENGCNRIAASRLYTLHQTLDVPYHAFFNNAGN